MIFTVFEIHGFVLSNIYRFQNIFLRFTRSKRKYYSIDFMMVLIWTSINDMFLFWTSYTICVVFHHTFHFICHIYLLGFSLFLFYYQVNLYLIFSKRISFSSISRSLYRVARSTGDIQKYFENHASWCQSWNISMSPKFIEPPCTLSKYISYIYYKFRCALTTT